MGFALASGDCGVQPLYYRGSSDDRWVIPPNGGTYYVNTYRYGTSISSTTGQDGRMCSYEDQTNAFTIGASTALTFRYSGQDWTVAVKECGTDATLASLALSNNAFNMQLATFPSFAAHAGKRAYLWFDDHHTGGWDHIQLDNIQLTNAVGMGPCS